MMELYQAYTDYHGMMELAETLISTVAREVLSTMKIEYQGQQVDQPRPDTVAMIDAVNEHSGVLCDMLLG